MNQFLKNHQLNKAEKLAWLMNQFQIELVISGLQDAFSSTKSSGAYFYTIYKIFQSRFYNEEDIYWICNFPIVMVAQLPLQFT